MIAFALIGACMVVGSIYWLSLGCASVGQLEHDNRDHWFE